MRTMLVTTLVLTLASGASAALPGGWSRVGAASWRLNDNVLEIEWDAELAQGGETQTEILGFLRSWNGSLLRVSFSMTSWSEPVVVDVPNSGISRIEFRGTNVRDIFTNGTSIDTEAHGYGGADRFEGGGGRDLFHGGDGDDELNGGDGPNELRGEEGADALYGGRDPDLLIGGRGADDVFGGFGDDTIWGDAKGEDAEPIHVVGTFDPCAIFFCFDEAGIGAQYFGDHYAFMAKLEHPDNDRLHGEAGNDLVHGGFGHDELVGGPGTDTLKGGSGVDYLHGGYACHTVGSNGSVWSCPNPENSPTGDGGDDLFGGRDDDYLFGGPGGDRLHGEEGEDVLWGDGGDDVLLGGHQDDTLMGGRGSDWLLGEWDRDHLAGGIDGSLDVLFGGTQADTFDVENAWVVNPYGGVSFGDYVVDAAAEDTVRQVGSGQHRFEIAR